MFSSADQQLNSVKLTQQLKLIFSILVSLNDLVYFKTVIDSYLFSLLVVRVLRLKPFAS